MLASDSGRRSEALSQGASASADLEAGADAADYRECGNDDESDMPLVRSPSWDVQNFGSVCYPEGQAFVPDLEYMCTHRGGFIWFSAVCAMLRCGVLG